MKPALFLTGASGFVGKRLLRLLDGQYFSRVVCLVRRPEALVTAGEGVEIEIVQGDLLRPETYAERLAGCETVVHMAAVTGKTRRTEMFRVNRDGTKALLDACRAAGVPNFLFVSSIAAKFNDVRRYYYAQSKREAESAVAASGLRYTIVRPTAIIGPGSGVLAGLAKLARTPVVTPIFGNGQTRIQPIYVDDLAGGLLTVVQEGMFQDEIVELGGPEVVTIEDFLQQIRAAQGLQPARVLHVPLRPVKTVLGWLEPWLLPLLPLTAGQLASFSEDGTVAPNPLLHRLAAGMKSVAEMINLASGKQEPYCHASACS